MRQGKIAERQMDRQSAWRREGAGSADASRPATRFVRTAARLDAFSAGHPMAEWLGFMARLARAQHALADMMGPLGSPNPIEREDAAEMTPPIAANGHRRVPIWRQGLALLLDGLDIGPAPAPVRLAMARLRDRGIDAQEALADDFLHGSVDSADVGRCALRGGGAAGLFHAPRRVLASIFLASAAPTRPLSLLRQHARMRRRQRLRAGPRRALSALLALWDRLESRAGRLHHLRPVALPGTEEIEGDSGAVRSETCDDCGTYAKMFYQAQDTGVDPIADDLATLGLDVLAGEEGWSRHAPNPFLLIGPGGSG